jgi:hypothetical protein
MKKVKLEQENEKKALAEEKKKEKTKTGKNTDKKKTEGGKDKAETALAWIPGAAFNALFGILNGIKVSVHRIHLRYEDDYFNNHRPFSMGMMIDQVSLDNTTSHWNFKTPFGMQFSR